MTTNTQSLIFKRINIYIQLFFLNLIDITVFGGNMFSFTNELNVGSIGMTLFFFSLLIAQISFNIFTSLPTSIIAGPIVEANKYMRIIFKNIQSQIEPEGVVINTLVAVAIATLIFAMISLILSAFDINYFIQMIPSQLTIGILGGIGLQMIFLGSELLEVKNVKEVGKIWITILLIITTAIFILQKKYNYSNFLAPFCSLILTLLVNLIVWIFKIKSNTLIDYSIFSTSVSLNEGLLLIRNDLHFSKINFSVLVSQWSSIFNLAFFCLLHLPINLSAWSKAVKINSNVKKEFRNQGLSNFLGSFFAFPLYFVCCYSIAFVESGCSSFLDAMVLTLIFSLIFFIAGPIRSNVPKIVLALFPALIGYSFCYDALVRPFYEGSPFDSILVLIISLLVGFDFLAIYVFIGGLIISLIYYFILDYKLRSYKDRFNQSFMDQFSEESKYIKIDFLVFFVNVHKLKLLFENVKEDKIIIDLTPCGAFDMLGNEVLCNLICDSKKYVIIGRPMCAVFNEIRIKSNVLMCRDYMEAAEKIN